MFKYFVILAAINAAACSTLRGHDAAVEHEHREEHAVRNQRRKSAVKKDFADSTLGRKMSRNPAKKQMKNLLENVGDVAERISNARKEGAKLPKHAKKNSKAKLQDQLPSYDPTSEDFAYFESDDFDFGNTYKANWLFTDYRARTDCSGPVASRFAENYRCFTFPMHFEDPGDVGFPFIGYDQLVNTATLVSSDVIVANGDHEGDEEDSTINSKRRYFADRGCASANKFEFYSHKTDYNERCEWGIQKRTQKNKVNPFVEKPGVLEMHFPTPYQCFRYASSHLFELVPHRALTEKTEAETEAEAQSADMKTHLAVRSMLMKHPKAEEFKKLVEADSHMKPDAVYIKSYMNAGPAFFHVDYYNVCVFDHETKLYHMFDCDAEDYMCYIYYFSDNMCNEFVGSESVDTSETFAICGRSESYNDFSEQESGSMIRVLVDDYSMSLLENFQD